MTRSHGHLATRFLVIAAAIQALGFVAEASSDDRQKHVLVLYSTRRDAQVAVLGEKDLPRMLDAGLPEGVDYYSEYIDRVRFAQPDYRTAFRDFLRLKYESRRFDVVIAMGDIPLEFVATNQDVLFADAPIVFYSNQPSPQRAKNPTGVVIRFNFSSTVDFARRLQPDLRQVFVVNGQENG